MKTTLYAPDQAHQVFKQLWELVKTKITAGQKMTIELKDEARSSEQNRLMWSCLSDLSKQVVWYSETLTKEDYKIMLTACLKKQRTVPGIEGGFVVLGASTSKMTKQEMTDLITLCHAFGDERGVKWSPTSTGTFDD